MRKTTRDVFLGVLLVFSCAAGYQFLGGKGVVFPRLSTDARDALTGVPPGAVIDNVTTNRIERWTGSGWSAIAGAGGTSGINLLSENGNFESGTAGWSVSAGEFKATTTAPDVADGVSSGDWLPDAAGDTLQSDQMTVRPGLFGRNCAVHGLYKKPADNGDHIFRVIDGSSNVLAEGSLPQVDSYSPFSMYFPCPNSGTLAFQVEAGSIDYVLLDNVFLGEARFITDIQTAEYVGSVKYALASGCEWSRTGAGADSFADFAADSDCSTPTVDGLATTSAGKIPGAEFSGIGPGRYVVQAQSTMRRAGTESGVGCRITDGTNHGEAVQAFDSTGGSSQDFPISPIAVFNYTTSPGNVTWRVQCVVNNTSDTVRLRADAAPRGFILTVTKYPLESRQAIKLDQVGWQLKAYLNGASPDLGTANLETFQEITDSGLTLTTEDGSIGAEIPCSSTNASSGTTCSVGDESVGIVFDVPQAGDVEVCVEFAHQIVFGNGGAGRAIIPFKLVETPNNAQTILQEGRANHSGGGASASVGGVNINTTYPHHLCHVFRFGSAGQKTIRLFRRQHSTETGSLNVNALLATNYDTAIKWTARPINNWIGQPLLVNSVVSPRAGVTRIVSAQIDQSGGTPSVNTQDGLWIDSITDNGVGNWTIVPVTGTFSSSDIHCACVSRTTNTSFCKISSSGTATNAIPVEIINNTGDNVDNSIQIICVGPR